MTPPRREAAQTNRPMFVLTLAMLTALSATTVDISLPAQPMIAEAFGARAEAGGIIVSAYFLGYGPGQIVWGPLADRFGRMLPLMIGLAGFVVATLACLIADSLETLAAFRLVQGVFGGSAPVIARAIARDQGGGARTARLLATIAIIFGAAPLLAPLLGSAILYFADWTMQFWFLAALGLVLMAAAPVFVGPAAGKRQTHVFSVGGYCSTVTALFLQRDFLIGCGAISSAMFGYATLLSAGAAMASTQYGIAPREFGPLFAVAASAVIFGAWFGGRLIRSRPPIAALRIGALICALAAMILLIFAWIEVPLLVLWTTIFAYVFGFGMILPMANAIALEPAGNSAGVASSLLGALSTAAGAVSAGLAASPVFVSAYQAICLIMAVAGICCFAIVTAGVNAIKRGDA
ncbi:MAG: Bcr/CflA family efflux MFS transporter [Alphaproteobacteria bacterium]|nr:Bcr/CflA family efflux MFS transporter [Alphaproteobacteria bacterium]